MTQTTDDTYIIRVMREGREEGFRLLMRKYREPIYWHIRRLVVSHADAEDAAQNTFIRIYRSFGQFRDDTSLRGWMFRIASNEALRLIASRKHTLTPLDCESPDARRLMADNYVDYTDLEAVRLQKAILTLPPKQQIAFNLRYYDELGYDEIAEATGSSPSAAKTNYHIAKEKIIRYMNSND